VFPQAEFSLFLCVRASNFCRDPQRVHHLTVILDAFSRRCIGWPLERYLETELARDALRMASATHAVTAEGCVARNKFLTIITILFHLHCFQDPLCEAQPLSFQVASLRADNYSPVRALVLPVSTFLS
jgi:hypothetical protein